jgi:hypothetical protein
MPVQTNDLGAKRKVLGVIEYGLLLFTDSKVYWRDYSCCFQHLIQDTLTM